MFPANNGTTQSPANGTSVVTPGLPSTTVVPFTGAAAALSAGGYCVGWVMAVVMVVVGLGLL